MRKKAPDRPPKRPKWKQYMIAYALLYGEFVWLERHVDGSITIPVRRMCSQFKLKSDQLKEMLLWLQGVGGLSVFKWYGHWALVKPAVPVGMERRVHAHVEHASDIVTSTVTEKLASQYENEDVTVDE